MLDNIKISHPVNPAPEGAQTWDTRTLQEQFQVHGFGSRIVSVTRKSDGANGTMQFNGAPRVYHSFQPA